MSTLEAAYFDGGVLTDDVFGFDLEFGLDGFAGSAVGRVPVSDACSLFAKLAVAAYDWGLHIEFEGIDISDGDFCMLGVSGLYRF
jgi:hypothetical protein